MMWILQDEIPDNVGVFIDDGGIKGPVSTYDNQVLEENSGIRCFIWEYAQTLERVLFRIEEAGLTILGKKFACCVPALDIVGHVVCKDGRRVSVRVRSLHCSYVLLDGGTESRTKFSRNNVGILFQGLDGERGFSL
jgi:hypothetical protein